MASSASRSNTHRRAARIPGVENDPQIRNHGTKQADARGLHVVGVGVLAGKSRPVRSSSKVFRFTLGICGETGMGADQIPCGKGTFLGISDTRDAGAASGFQATGWLVFPGQDLHFGFQKTRLYLWDNRLRYFDSWRPGGDHHMASAKVENGRTKFSSVETWASVFITASRRDVATGEKCLRCATQRRCFRDVVGQGSPRKLLRCGL